MAVSRTQDVALDSRLRNTLRSCVAFDGAFSSSVLAGSHFSLIAFFQVSGFVRRVPVFSTQEQWTT